MKKITQNIDVIIHAAAYPHESLSVFSPHLISDSIIGASTSTFSAAIENKVKRIVFCSSIARYGHVEIPYEENDQKNPLSLMVFQN